MSLALKECGHTQTINIINGVCLMKEELLDETMLRLLLLELAELALRLSIITNETLFY